MSCQTYDILATVAEREPVTKSTRGTKSGQNTDSVRFLQNPGFVMVTLLLIPAVSAVHPSPVLPVAGSRSPFLLSVALLQTSPYIVEGPLQLVPSHTNYSRNSLHSQIWTNLHLPITDNVFLTNIPA